jgi:hypothetical protein
MPVYASERLFVAQTVFVTHYRSQKPRQNPRREPAMITEFVLFDLPVGMTREEVVAGMHKVAPKWRANPRLVRKTFIYDAEARKAGAYYLWPEKSDAEAAHDAAWRQSIREGFGSDPEIRYFETPVVIDNALGRIVTEDAEA